MEGPRSPHESEYSEVVKFLDGQLRPHASWSISKEYPTAITPSNLHNMRIITDAERVLSHAVLKPLITKGPTAIIKIAAIGSVVTDETHRNQGLSKQIILNCLDEARNQECDIAVLWTNLYDFYRKMNFELAGAEISCIFENEFAYDTKNLKFLKSNQVSAEALHKLYSQHTVGSVRTAEDFKKFLAIPQTHLYTVWDNQGQLVAYAAEGKGIDLTGYIHEWGGKASALTALFGYIRQEAKAPITVIMSKQAENLLQQLQPIGPTINFGYLGMIKIVHHDQLFAKIKRAARSIGISNLVLEKQNGNYIFGIGNDLVTIDSELSLTQVLFGPMPEISSFSEATITTLEKVLPLPLWVWGWDSI